MTARVLVVEDDRPTAHAIIRGLRSSGFNVEAARDGDDAVSRILSARFDAVVLDLLLGGEDGLDVLARVRNRTRAAITVLSARTDLAIRLRAFDLGAWDFVAKPFWTDELVARVRSSVAPPDPSPEPVVRCGDLVLDVSARTCKVKGAPVDLTPAELAVLAYLMQRPGTAVSRRTLVARALRAGATEERTIASHIARIRRKLGPRGAAIATVWGLGYRFDGK